MLRIEDLPSCSIILTSREEEWSKLREVIVLYRDLTPHWEGQLGKFLPRKAARTVEGDHVPIGVAKLMANHPTKTYVDPHGRRKPVLLKRGTWLIKDVTNESSHPEDGRPCWVLLLEDLEA